MVARNMFFVHIMKLSNTYSLIVLQNSFGEWYSSLLALYHQRVLLNSIMIGYFTLTVNLNHNYYVVFMRFAGLYGWAEMILFLTILLWKLICRYCSGPHIGFGCGRCFKSVMMTPTCWRMHADHWRQRLCKFSPTMDGDLAIGLLFNKFPWEFCWCLLFTFVNFMSVFADGGAAVWCNKRVVGCSLYEVKAGTFFPSSKKITRAVTYP